MLTNVGAAGHRQLLASWNYLLNYKCVCFHRAKFVSCYNIIISFEHFQKLALIMQRVKTVEAAVPKVSRSQISNINSYFLSCWCLSRILSGRRFAVRELYWHSDDWYTQNHDGRLILISIFVNNSSVRSHFFPQTPERSALQNEPIETTDVRSGSRTETTVSAAEQEHTVDLRNSNDAALAHITIRVDNTSDSTDESNANI